MAKITERKIKTRQLILSEAARLFHTEGYGHTGLYDVAEALHLKQAHIYYHFKTKRELALAVLDQHSLQVTRMLSEIDEVPAKESLLKFMELSASIEGFYMQGGCPIATLTDALIRDSKNKKERAEVPLIFETQIEWFKEKFEAIGIDRFKAKAQAEKTIVNLQGAILLAFTLRKPKIYNQFIKNQRAYFESINSR